MHRPVEEIERDIKFATQACLDALRMFGDIPDGNMRYLDQLKAELKDVKDNDHA